MTPVLISPRLLLRPFEHEDAPAWAHMLNDASVATGVCSTPLPFTQLHASARILMIRAREGTGDELIWAVEDMEGHLVGSLGLGNISSGIAGLGYAFARNHWGKGYASEALAAVMDWVGRKSTIGEIRAEVFHDNPASARVLAKAGFVETGHGARFSLARDGSEATRTFALLKVA